MKNLLLILILSSSIASYGQKEYLQDVSASQIINVMDQIGFKPIKLTKDVKLFQLSILELPNDYIKQLNISTWWLCSNRREDNFKIFKLLYKEILWTTFEKYCKEITALMLCDGTIEQPK